MSHYIDIVPCHTIAVWVQINYIEVDVLKNTGTVLCPYFDSNTCQNNLFIILILYIIYNTHSTGNEKNCVSQHNMIIVQIELVIIDV